MPDEASHPDHPIHRLEAQRRVNRDAAVALGVDPYGSRVDDIVPIAEALRRYDADADAAHHAAGKAPPAGYVDRRAVVTIAGRVVLKRDGGKLIWMQVRDHTSGPKDRPEDAPPPTIAPPAHDLQIAVSKADVRSPGFDLAKSLDLGDIVVARGPLMKTRAGEITVWASRLDLAAKSLAPPPEKWKGLTDVEARSRRRYVDLYTNPEVLQSFLARSRLASLIRRFLEDRGFVEVETPVLQPTPGGAAARPFITRHNALGINLYLRVAPELYLKRLLVGGMPRVYEWSRNFRNEGMDRTHNPEFSMLELYEAFGDYESMMRLTESLVRECAREAARFRPGVSAAELRFGEVVIDYESPFERTTYAELFERALGFPMADSVRARVEAERRGIPTKSKTGQALDPVLIVHELFRAAERSLDPSRPTFILDYPAPLCPLTRPKKTDPTIAERFELFIAGMEVANAYTELNDPDLQEAKFREQLAGLDEEEATFRTLDHDFIEALKVGMPPAGGLGVGLDRLFMVLLNQHTIRDAILFPLMRPVEEGL